MTIEEAIATAASRRSLTEAQAAEVMDFVMQGGATHAQIAGWVVALRMKGESVAELVGFATSMRTKVTPVAHSKSTLVDTCGTGGDTVKTFNLSTAAAIVASATGVPIAKHGNRAVTSACGSSDVLEALGLDLGMDPATALEDCGIAFLFAPNHHPAMRHAAAPRREIKLRTVFNLLGPLTNPAGARRQLLGVYAPELVTKMARALRRLGCEKGVVAHGMIGLDEVSPTGETKLAIVEKGRIRETLVTPDDFGFEPPRLEEIRMGDGGPLEAASRMRRAISDSTSPECRAILPSAAVAVWLGDAADNFEQATGLARAAVASGAAEAKLEQLLARSRA